MHSSVLDVPPIVRFVSTNAVRTWKVRYPTAIVCHRYRLLFFPIPKVATSSIRKLIARLEGRSTLGNPHHDIELESVWTKDLRGFEGYTRFTVVRNPWDRLASCYFDKIAGQTTDTDFSTRQGIHEGFERYNRLLPRRLFYQSMSFLDFLRTVSKIPDWISDEHFRSQYRMLSGPDGELMTENILKFEDLPHSINSFLDAQQINVRLEDRANRTKHDDYRSYYCKTANEIVARRYRHDIHLFSYYF